MTESTEAEQAGDGESEERHSFLRRGWIRFAGIITPIAALFITLGEASDATFLLRDLTVEVVSLVSNRVEYGRLADLHVGNTAAYVEELYGVPQVSRSLPGGATAEYVHDSKHLVTLFLRDGRVVGFTVVPLREGFSPEVQLGANDRAPLLDFAFDRIQRRPDAFAVDQGRTGSFYLEAYESGPGMRFMKIYLGSIDYGAGGATEGIRSLYQAELTGTPDAAAVAQASLRREGTPNLYGQGELDLEAVQAAVLTNAEFDSYFGTD